MRTIRPSEGLKHLKETVFVEGIIAGPKTYSNNYGGRWIIEIADANSQDSTTDAILVANENPNQNPAIKDLCKKPPNDAILSIFRNDEFAKLFQPGTVFRAESIVDRSNGLAWFNIWQIFLLEPYFKIGAKQIYNEPLCQRRLFLRSRGIKEKKVTNDEYTGHFFVGNLVHSIFQKIALSNDRSTIVSDFRSNPDKFLLNNLLPKALLVCGMSKQGSGRSIGDRELSEVKKHIMRLVNSSNVLELVSAGNDWVSEVPVSGTSIHGEIDIRDKYHLLELKTGQSKSSHKNQLKSYLIGDMLEKGSFIMEELKAYLIYSNSYISEENRVYEISNSTENLIETLNRFTMARHRLLLVNAGLKLPKIEFEANYCKSARCHYFKDDAKETSGCHFYCQIERSWSCEDCKHASFCNEHTKLHSLDVIDEANRIRKALINEIEFMRRKVNENYTWAGTFKVIEDKGNNIYLVVAEDGFGFDPPSSGEKILIHKPENNFPSIGYVLGIATDYGYEIISHGGMFLEKDEVIKLEQPRSELNGLFELLECLDELQRLGAFSHREGIAFSGGNVISGQPEKVFSIKDAIHEKSVTDIFCQSFNLDQSEKLLLDAIENIEGTTLIVTEAITIPVKESFDTRGKQVIDLISSQDSLSGAILKIKAKLESCSYWITSPDMLLNDNEIFESLPSKGNKYFDYIIVYETNNIAGLEYFLLRRFGKRIIVIGDANNIGRPLKTQQAKLLGLGDNLVSRVFDRGFPKVDGKMHPKIVLPIDQPISLGLKKALERCRMVSTDSGRVGKQVNIIPSNDESQGSTLSPLYFLEIEPSVNVPPKKVELKINEFITLEDYQKDLEELKDKIKFTLVGGEKLTTLTSGRTYEVMGAPINRNEEVNNWLIKLSIDFESQYFSKDEALQVVEKFRQLKKQGIEPKDIAIMSTSQKQLTMIAEECSGELSGVSLRTPYGIKGECWDYVIITCATKNAFSIQSRELYTMLRASRFEVYLICDSNLLNNHPFIRNMHS